MKEDFRTELQSLINRHSRENESNTPDFILAKFMHDCLAAFDHAVASRDDFYQKALKPGGKKP